MVRNGKLLHSLLLEGSKPTALRKDDGFHLMLRQAHSIDPHIPIRFEGSADAEEQENAHGGEEGNVCYESVHGLSHLPGVAYAEKKQADRDLHECESDECLYPIGPANNLEQPSLRSSQVVLVSSESREDFRRDQSSANQRRQLIKVTRSVPMRKDEGLLLQRKRVLTMAATAT